MGDTFTGSRTSVFPSFKSFDLSEVPWWILCCRVFERSFSWRQIPAQVRLADVEKAQGKRPEALAYPPEPVFIGDPGNPEARQEFEQNHQEWSDLVQAENIRYQTEVLEWESRGARIAQRWDLSPMPELAPFDSRPPEQREWIPVRVFENEAMRSQKTQRVPTTVRNWREREGKWRETLMQGVSWKPYATEDLKEMHRREAYIHQPETLMLAVPGEDFLPFLNQLERGALALVRCCWDAKAGKLVQAGLVPQTFVQPAVEIVASVALAELGTLPITRWLGAPEELAEKVSGWEPGQQVPVTRVQFSGLERWISGLSTLPRWYADPEYRSLAAVNLCWHEGVDQWGEAYLWRPLLEVDSESPDPEWQPKL